MAPKQIMEITEEDLVKYDWISLRKDMDELGPTESFTQKFARKFYENPLVPIGAACTTVALSYGLWTFRTGQRRMSQYMMRTRIAAQGLTVFALIAGIAMGTQKVVKK